MGRRYPHTSQRGKVKGCGHFLAAHRCQVGSSRQVCPQAVPELFCEVWGALLCQPHSCQGGGLGRQKLWAEPRASYTQSKCSPTELHPLCMGKGGGLAISPHLPPLPQWPTAHPALPQNQATSGCTPLSPLLQDRDPGRGDVPMLNTLSVPTAPGTGVLLPPWPWSHWADATS